jgi:hypothetical protein
LTTIVCDEMIDFGNQLRGERRSRMTKEQSKSKKPGQNSFRM